MSLLAYLMIQSYYLDLLKGVSYTNCNGGVIDEKKLLNVTCEKQEEHQNGEGVK